MKRVGRWSMLLIVALLVRPVGAEVYGEYAVKAAYLFNFARYAEWPPQTFAGADAALTVCVVGDNPFNGELEGLEGKAVAERPLVVRYLANTSRFNGCQILFISRSERPRLANLLRTLTGVPALTVSDIDDFAEAGGMIGLVESEQRIRFDINVDAVQRAGLKLSSQLLKLARIINNPRGVN